jgi:hypothetical protein
LRVVIRHEGWRYPKDDALGRAARGAGASTRMPHRRARRLSPSDVRRPGQQLRQDGRALPRRREHLLLRPGQSASEGAPTTSAIAAPDGRLLCYQLHGVPGMLDLSAATGLLAQRCRVLGL